MGRYALFLGLLTTAILWELVDAWQLPPFIVPVAGLALIATLRGMAWRWALLFLVAATLYFLAQFPDVANHVTLLLYCNLVAIFGIVRSRLRATHNGQAPDIEKDFLPLWPLLRIGLVIVYFLAGFHKLNDDFFNAEVSCASVVFASGLQRIWQSRLLGLPGSLVLAALIGLGTIRYWRASRRLRRASGAILLFVLGSTVVTSIALALLSPLTAEAQAAIAFATGPLILVLAWELFGTLGLLLGRWQGAIVLFSGLMHGALALIGFADFSALGFALLATFLSDRDCDTLTQGMQSQEQQWRPNRLQIYIGINAVGGLLVVIHRHLLPIAIDPVVFSGLLLDGAFLWLMWPIWRSDRPRQADGQRDGVAIWQARTPPWLWVLPLMLAAYGLTPYLGLRTTGNFSMFSNLRTEVTASNHWLLRGNPLKIWSYQEDVVEVVAIDDERAAIGYQYAPIEGMLLPAVEFKKLIYQWSQAERQVPVVFNYRGQTYFSQDITQEPEWRTEGRSWSMRLLDFRVIQPQAPNQCRW